MPTGLATPSAVAAARRPPSPSGVGRLVSSDSIEAGGFTPMAMITVGYPRKVEELPEALRKREPAPRQRRAVSEIAFTGRWNEPYKAGKV